MVKLDMSTVKVDLILFSQHSIWEENSLLVSGSNSPKDQLL